MADRPTLGIIGAGKVGQTLARLWHSAGYPIRCIHSRTPAHAETLARQVAASIAQDPREVVTQADLTLLTVPDNVIAEMAQRLSVDELSGKAVVHTSGVYNAEVLAALKRRGGMVGSLHPVFPFADVESAVHGLAGTTFALEAEDDLLVDWLGDMVAALNSTILRIPPDRKALYHAALVIASNYTVSLYALAERLLLSLSADRAAVDNALNALVAATTANLIHQGIPAALTGPLARADLGTIKAHLEVLEVADAEAANIYRDLARLSLSMVAQRGVEISDLKTLLDRR